MTAYTSLFSTLVKRARIIACLATLTLTLALSSYAEEFTVRNVGDYGNVTVMEVSGNYDAENSERKKRDTSRISPKSSLGKILTEFISN